MTLDIERKHSEFTCYKCTRLLRVGCDTEEEGLYLAVKAGWKLNDRGFVCGRCLK